MAMTVDELIAILSEMDGDAEVYTHNIGSYAPVVEVAPVHMSVGEGGPLDWVRIEA